MDIQEPQNTSSSSDLINDENNNCQYKNHLDEKVIYFIDIEITNLCYCL